MYGGEDSAYKDYIGVHGVQAEELQPDKRKETASGPHGDKKILPVLQKAYDA